jgi:uncharacterized membrane protein
MGAVAPEAGRVIDSNLPPLPYPYFAAFLLGLIAGLRTFTAPAVLWLIRHRTPAAYVLGALALAEYAGDLHPNAPPRTKAVGLVARLFSGAFCGWAVTSSAGGSVALGAAVGALGALVGAYLGLAARMRAVGFIGRVPAALTEDAVAILGAVAVVLGLA